MGLEVENEDLESNSLGSDTILQNLGFDFDYKTTGETFKSPFKSISITALKSDVTINTIPLPVGMSISLDSGPGEQYSEDVVVGGSGYYVTFVKSI